MSDETTESTTEQPAGDLPADDTGQAEIEAEARLEAELRASMPSGEELLGLEPKPPAPPAEDAPPPADAAGDEAPDDAPPPAEEGDEKPWTWSRIRRARKEIGSERERLAAEAYRLQQEQARLQPVLTAQQELRQLAAANPAEAFRRFSELTGRPPRELYESVVQSYLMQGTPEEREKAISPETRALQQRLDEMEAAQKKAQEQQQQWALEQTRQREASLVYQVAINGADDGKGNVTSYPYLAALPPAELETAIRTAVNLAAELRAEHGVVRTVGQVCAALDQQARKAYEYTHGRLTQRLQASSKAGAPGANGESQESSRDEDKPVGEPAGRRSERKQRTPKAPGNRAGAGTSAGARSRTPDEIDDELERQLREGFQGHLADMTG